MPEAPLIWNVYVLRGTAVDCKHQIIYAEQRENHGENKAFLHFLSLIHYSVERFSQGLKRIANFSETFEVGVRQHDVASGDGASGGED